MGGVDALEVAERRQQADADVHGAVADREDPAVAGHRLAVAVLDVERRLDPRVGVARRLPVGADGRAVGPVSRRRDVPRARPKRLLAPSATMVNSARISTGGPTRRPSTRSTVAPRTKPRSTTGCSASWPCSRRGPGGDRVVGDHRVEVAAAHDVAVARVHRVARPLQLELAAGPGRPQPAVAVEPGEPVGEAHLVELVHRPRREAVAARLVARERLALDDRDVVAVAGEPVRRRGAGRATADDEHLGGDDVAGVGRRGAGREIDDRAVDGGQATRAVGAHPTGEATIRPSRAPGRCRCR